MIKLTVLIIVVCAISFSLACRNVHHFYDPATGNYIKSACSVPIKADYQDAERICRQLRMELFTLEDQQMAEAFQKAMGHRFAGNFTWINGRRLMDDSWHAYNPSKKSFYQLDWLPLPTTTLLSNCLGFSDSDGASYKYVATQCEQVTQNTRFTCEYIKEPTLNTDFCMSKSPIKDLNDVTLTNACYVGTEYNYWEAEQYCLNKGMSLFAINTAAVHDAFIADSFSKYGTLFWAFWINGQYEGSSNWFTYNPKKTSFYIDFEPPLASDKCLANVFNHNTNLYEPHEEACANTYYQICEYGRV